jgi:predicted RNase H-like HicB family nuclease
MKPMRTYTVVVEPEAAGGFIVSVPALPGCYTHGRSLGECRDRAAEAIAVHIAGLEADGEPIPDEVGALHLLRVSVGV